ncbi:hypothetical protein ORF002 [Yersinia phage PYps23T]|uniref:Uncharacterized protein n=1 Tax=Yersinia phage PYps23T TaxID=2801356 RepID=A0AAE7TQE4_9CAUD|nr:hypothetical protein QNG99_gp02 [Yersinia phage PYps23T]QQO90921.1 hypothetical protein ORF002 [Yersinia phage PYps23T]
MPICSNIYMPYCDNIVTIFVAQNRAGYEIKFDALLRLFSSFDFLLKERSMSKSSSLAKVISRLVGGP